MNTFKLRLEAHEKLSHPGSTRDEIMHWNNRYRQSLTRCGLKIVESEDELPPNIHEYIQAPIVCPGSLNPWKQPSFIVAMTDGEWAAAIEGTQTPRAATFTGRRSFSGVTFNDLEFQNGRLVKVGPYDRYQYFSGDELIALVGRLGEMLYEAKEEKDGTR